MSLSTFLQSYDAQSYYHVAPGQAPQWLIRPQGYKTFFNLN